MGNSVMLNVVEYAGEQIAYKDSTYELVSKVAYLIGVPLRIFQNEHEPPKIEIYNRLEQDKNARIIRNLCIIRTAIERNYRKINDIMRMEYRGLLSMPEILPTSSMQQLSNDGISFIKKSSTKLCHHIIEINRLISDRINNCKSLFPIWINWTYIKELFIMPNGLTEDGTKDAADIYYARQFCTVSFCGRFQFFDCKSGGFSRKTTTFCVIARRAHLRPTRQSLTERNGIQERGTARPRNDKQPRPDRGAAV